MLHDCVRADSFGSQQTHRTMNTPVPIMRFLPWRHIPSFLWYPSWQDHPATYIYISPSLLLSPWKHCFFFFFFVPSRPRYVILWWDFHYYLLMTIVLGMFLLVLVCWSLFCVYAIFFGFWLLFLSQDSPRRRCGTFSLYQTRRSWISYGLILLNCCRQFYNPWSQLGSSTDCPSLSACQYILHIGIDGVLLSQYWGRFEWFALIHGRLSWNRGNNPVVFDEITPMDCSFTLSRLAWQSYAAIDYLLFDAT